MDNKKVAIMQPYIFPYLGYFQLIHAVDTFIFYDDVNFIKQGWINRNKLLINKKASLFTIPVKKVSSFEEIKNTEINYNNYSIWSKKFIKSIRQNYKNAPFYGNVFPIIENVLSDQYKSISDLAIESIKQVFKYLNYEKEFLLSSDEFEETKGLDKADRIIEICKRVGADQYINPSGGVELYDKEYFSKHNVRLNFIKNTLPQYEQFDNEFISGLSIIDIMMFNSPSEIICQLSKFSYD